MDDFNTEKARENTAFLKSTLPLQNTTPSLVMQQEKSFYTSSNQQNNILEFEEAMRRDGFHFPGTLIPDGQIHRFSTKKKNKKDGFCFLNKYSGWYGDWSTDKKYQWNVSLEGKKQWEISIINQDIEKSKKDYEEETEKRNLETAIEAEALWDNARDEGTSEYLENKQVPAFNLKYSSDEYGDFVAVPIRDIEGKLWNIQKIYPKRADGGNHKWPLRGGKKIGCFHTLGTSLHELPERSRVFVAEGYATAASIHMATGDTVIMAVDSGNIDPVVKAIKIKYPHILGIIAGDEDRWSEEDRNAGREKAEAAALKYGWPVVFPEFKEEHHHERPTDFNDLHHLEGIERVTEQLHILLAEENNSVRIPNGFISLEDGIYYTKLVTNPETKEKETNTFKLCSPLYVTALTCDENEENWGRILEFKDPKQKTKEFVMPMELLARNGDELRTVLFAKGLILEPGQEARKKLENYISSSDPKDTVLCVDTRGWHKSQYISPHKSYLFEGEERIVYQSKGIPPKPIKIKGTHEEWQTHIGKYIVGNPLLILSACAALAGPFLFLLQEENCMFHLYGPSSIGKTTAAHVARSMWGIPIYSWRTTDNAAESIAQNANDGLVIFDEMAEVDAKAADNISYMLGNGAGKARSDKNGNARPQKIFRLIGISTGEIRLEGKLKDIGKSQKAGQSVRFIELEADAKKGHGIFETLHEFKDGNSLSVHLRQMSDQFCGAPVDSLITYLTTSQEHQDNAVKIVKELRKAWLAKYASQYTEGQIQRCAKKFALLAAIGEFAVYIGLLQGFSSESSEYLSLGDLSEGMFQNFTSWLKNRGGEESHELIEIKEQLVNFIMEHGSSRFEAAWEEKDEKIINRVGFRRKIDGYTQYYFEKGQFKKEILKGKSTSYIKRLIDDRYLTGDQYGDNIRMNPQLQMRLLVVSPDILNKGNDNE